MERIQRADLNFQVVELIAKRSTCARAHVGALATREGRIIATGYNGVPVGAPHCSLGTTCDCDKPCTRAIHAEANLIAFAAKFGTPLNNSELWVNMSPCIKCAELIIQSGIKAVHYRIPYRDEAGLILLKQAGIELLQEKEEYDI